MKTAMQELIENILVDGYLYKSYVDSLSINGILKQIVSKNHWQRYFYMRCHEVKNSPAISAQSFGHFEGQGWRRPNEAHRLQSDPPQENVHQCLQEAV